MTASRGGALRKVEADLGPRDWAVLHDLARVRLLTGRMVQRLHVHEGSSLTQARRTRSLLQRLHDLGLVHRSERRIGGVYAGSAGFVYGLTAVGQRLTTKLGPAGGKRLRRPWEPAAGFVDHVLAVSELYVKLREAERGGEVDLISFEAEPAGWRWWVDVSGKRLVLKPDAVVVLGSGDIELHEFVEVDRSTESGTVLKRKALVYVDYWQAGVEQAKSGIFPLVVWLVPDERRKQQLVEVLARLPPEAWQLFTVGLYDRAVDSLTNTTPNSKETCNERTN